ncbi:MAG: peptidyl-prolyl cis-trans isomerase [Flavobacteriales bacterium]|nr:peptidyl-prolyl cis-trans isomerase [Flavobacteriales bacterium]
MIRKIVFTIIVFATLFSCSDDFDVERGKVIARVGNNYLYYSDIQKLLNDDVKGNDSIAIVDAYITRWARKKVILEKAQLNLGDEDISFKRLVEEYREDLITNAYRSQLVSQYLDTIVSENEILSYYNDNKDAFLLNQNLVIMKYADLPSNISDKEEILRLFKSNDVEDVNKLEEICYQYSNRFGISDSSWVAVDEIRFNMPELNSIKNSELLKKDNFIVLQDSLNLYLTRIIDLRLKKDVAPVSFVEQRIKNIVLNKRKLVLMREMEDQIMKDAIKNNEFETYK